MSTKIFEKIFNPKVIAVIGASNKIGSVGNSVMRNIIGAGFEGIVYPINPKRDSIIGIKTYKSVEDVPDKIDLAIITTPARLFQI